MDPDVAVASLQGTLAELARMLQVGVIPGPALRWKGALITLFRRLVASSNSGRDRARDGQRITDGT